MTSNFETGLSIKNLQKMMVLESMVQFTTKTIFLAKTPQCTPVNGLMVYIRWYLRCLKG